MICGSAPATCRNRSNTRPRPATCSRSSAARPSMCSRCWTRWSKPPPGFAAPIPATSRIARARSTATVGRTRKCSERRVLRRSSAPATDFVPGRDSDHRTGGCSKGRVVHITDVRRRSRTTRCPRLWRPGDRTILGVPAAARGRADRHDYLWRGNGSSRSPSGRSNWCAPSPTRRSSRSRTRGCSANCRPARATSKNRSNTRPRPATCSRSSAARPPMCNRCWTQWSKRPPGFAAPIPQRS